MHLTLSGSCVISFSEILNPKESIFDSPEMNFETFIQRSYSCNFEYKTCKCLQCLSGSFHAMNMSSIKV